MKTPIAPIARHQACNVFIAPDAMQRWPLRSPSCRGGARKTLDASSSRRRSSQLSRVAASSSSSSSSASPDAASTYSSTEETIELRLDRATMELLTDLPGTRTPKALAARATALSAWRARLARGVLPEVRAIKQKPTSTSSPSHPWPDPELASALVSALRDLEMPRFCSKHPALLDTLLKQLVGLVNDYEKALAEAGLLDEEGNRVREEEEEEVKKEEDGESGFDEDFGKEEQNSSSDEVINSSSSGRGGSGGGQGGEEGEEGEEDCDPDALDDDESGDNENGSGSRGQRQRQSKSSSSSNASANLDLEASLEQALSDDELAEMLRKQQEKLSEEKKKGPSSDEIASKLSKELADKLSKDWKDAAQSLRAAEAALDPEAVESLIASDPAGFDSSSGLWQDLGWREVASLSKVLSDCKELRDLVRSLGRSAGRGPRRRAPAQVAAPPRAGSPGVLRSALQPEETAGLARSGDISRMLPSEAHLVAAGWPRGRGVATRSVEVSASIDDDAGEEGDESGSDESGGGDDGGGGERRSRNLFATAAATTTVSVVVEGSRPARLLHMARRAERTLMSYERDGWLDDPSTRPTRRFEVRPAAEDGPLILCLDTSGSMAGARERVAKAVALEAARSARRARRRCLLYAFSGPGDLRQLELDPSTTTGATDLLSFLRCSFGGGTDADAPLEAALMRLEESEWAAADVLMVTDGEIPPPNPEVGARLARAKEELGLQVHGLLVGGRSGGGDGSGSSTREPISEGVAAICSRVHVFKSWSAVGGR